MPRKYTPAVDFDPYDRCFPWGAKMKESRTGEYVKLSTYNDERAFLLAQITRLKDQVKKLQEIVQPEPKNANQCTTQETTLDNNYA